VEEKMKLSIAVGCLMVLWMGCATAPSERAKTHAFKGMELYSWKPEGEGWYFSLLPGTNREKTPEEITGPGTAIVGVPELKRRLSKLAKGESIFWRNVAKETVPEEMKKELESHCEELRIKLVTI
jgi:hypothetical protein